MRFTKEGSGDNTVLIAVTIAISILIGVMISTIIWDRHPHTKNVTFTVPSGKEQKFDIRETDSTIDIQLK